MNQRHRHVFAFATDANALTYQNSKKNDQKKQRKEDVKKANRGMLY